MASKKFGEMKGPFIMWFFFTLYFAALNVFGSSSGGTLPQDVSAVLVLYLLFNMMVSGGALLVFLIAFLVLWERQRTLRDIFSSMGLKREGFVKSMFWSVALFPLALAIGLIMMILSYFLVQFHFYMSTFPSVGSSQFGTAIT